MATRDPDYILKQINSLLDGSKTPSQVRIEDGISRGSDVAPTYTVPTNVPEGLGSAAPYYHSNTFTPSETYKLRSEGYYDQGDTALGDAYKALWSGSNIYSNTANQITDFYSQLASDVAKREMALAGVKEGVANKLFNGIEESKAYVNSMFGPNGTLTREVNKYYDDLGNYLSTDAGRQAATIAAQGAHTGASLGSIRAQQNEAYNQSFQRYIQAKEQEINAKQAIASNLINFMSTLRKEYGDTTNTYIISQYQRANDLLEAISQSIADANKEVAGARLTNATKSSSSSSNNMEDALGWLSKLLTLGTEEETTTDEGSNEEDERFRVVS